MDQDGSRSDCTVYLLCQMTEAKRDSGDALDNAEVASIRSDPHGNPESFRSQRFRSRP